MEKQKGKRRSSSNTSSSGIKILNDKKIAAQESPTPVMTTVPLSPPKQITMSIAKPKKTLKQKNMDHYVMKTVKGEKKTDTGEDESETIDFILADDEEEEEAKPTGEITEELHLSDDDDDEVGSTREIVEHVCGKCFKSFRKIKSLKKHIDFCRFDSTYHLRKAEMLKNLEKIEKDAVIMEKKDVCFCCGESYDTFHLGHINCPDCPKSFKTQMSYERHIFITHSEFDDHPCSICNAKLRSANLLKLHEEQHRNRGKPFACKICGKDFTRSYHLSRHQKYSSCSANENDSIRCKVCDKGFYRLDNLRVHLKQHFGAQTAKKIEYTCPTCKKCFYSLSTLNIHTRTHTGERPFDCDLCEKKFPSLVALKKHRRYHTGEKPYTCSVCKQSFAVKEVLNRHMKRHTGERPHVCSECGKSFIQGSQLRTHIKTHVRPYTCEECSEKFKTEKQLLRHIKEHNVAKRKKDSGQKKGRTRLTKRCDICKIGFKTDLEFEKHMKDNVHTTPPERRKRKYRTDCAVCNLNFDTVQSLQFHILKVHQEDPETFINENLFDNDKTLMPPPKMVIKIEDAEGQRIEFVTTNSEGKILNTNIEGLKEQQVLKPSENNTEENKVNILEQYIIEQNPSTSTSVAKQTFILSNEAFTVIPLESNGGIIEPITTQALPTIISPDTKKEQRKTLAESLAAAIADNDEEMLENAENEAEMEVDEESTPTEEELKIKDNVSKLLDMLVDTSTLKKFGWPDVTEEIVLCKVIENCGHDLSKDQYNYSSYDYASRMREYVKLLFTVVIHNDSIKELLNNYPIDEVIEYVLGNDDDEEDEADKNDDDDEVTDKDNNKAIKREKDV